MSVHADVHGSRGTGHTQRLGAIGFWGGIAGAVSAVVLIVYPPAVEPERFSYPFDAIGFTAAQVFFAVQHVTMALTVVALLTTAAGRSARLTRSGCLIAITGLVLLTVLELVAVTAAHAVSGEPFYAVIQSLVAVPTIITGLGLILGGLGVLRSGVWTGVKRFLPLILGVYVFVALTPAIMGPHIVGRIGIGVWVLLFAVLGWILWRGDPEVAGAVDAPLAAPARQP